MRAISLVNKLEFNILGNVAKNALTLGDVDNDGCIELVVGNNKGEVTIFKGKEKFQTISDLTFISCIAVGDIFNKKRNCLVIITADGWCLIYEVPYFDSSFIHKKDEKSGLVVDNEDVDNSSDNKKFFDKSRFQLVRVHCQRIPANAKNILLGDIDGDGLIEMILGLTDRVVRTYRWFPQTMTKSEESSSTLEFHRIGKLIALNKWECANQIGSITLHHSSEGKPALLIAQPGGTFMRIRCHPDDYLKEALDNLEIKDNNAIGGGNVIDDDIDNKDNGKTVLSGSAIDYQFLGINRMRNQNISTEILGDFETGNPKKPYALATLDGTIMLVQDETILWAIAVDHQIFALTKMDVTGNGKDDIVVCSWDGQTYILDQDKNSVRFHLDDSVQAFHSGYYHLLPNKPPVSCFIYVTFKNTLIIYYDIPLKELVIRKNLSNLEMLYNKLIQQNKTSKELFECVNNKTKNELVEFLLYNVKTTN